MQLPALPYKQLATSLALAGIALLAAHAAGGGLLPRGPRMLVSSAPVPVHLAPQAARTSHVVSATSVRG
jgi:hypothetical protein